MPININHNSDKIKADADLKLDAGSSNNIDVSAKIVKNATDPVDAQDLATKSYVDNATSSGGQLTLGTPTDGSLTTDGALQTFTTATTITDAIDDLNETIENIRNNTFVKEVDFTGSPLVGGAGLAVTLNISAVGNANRYTINWGDGTTDTATTDSTPTHTYASNTGSPFTVNVEAFNNSGAGTGSTASKEKTAFVTIFTATPVVSFAAYSAPTGGSPITQWDDGDTIYFENTTTNTGGATIQYTWEWGDGSSDDVISSDSVAGGVGGGRIAHTFALSTEQEVQRTVTLTLDSHSTATPGTTPTDDDATYKIYDDHTPEVALDITTGINEQASSGLTVTFTNNTENTVGSYGTYGNRYLYTWGDGQTQFVNAGSNSSGDHGRTITHRYSLSASDQANGTPRDYTGNLQLQTDHSNSPFTTANFTVHLEPDVRASISGTATRVSDRSGDNSLDVYDGTTYDGVNHALVQVTNSTQNADDYVYNWNDGSANDTVTEDGSSPGSINQVITHDFTGVTPGNYTLNFTANGTPDITAQTDTDSIVFQVNAVPAAPAGLSSKTIQLSDSAEGASPKLAHGFTDNSATNPVSAGANLNQSTVRRYANTGTIDSTTAGNAYDGTSGTVSVVINGTVDGSQSFTTALNENGTNNALVVSDQRDANDTVSGSTYPTGFYQTFDSRIAKTLSGLPVGVNDARIEHSTTGNTNYVTIVRDDITTSPTLDLTSATLTENNAGTYRYISGIPYYNSGSPTLQIGGAEVYNWIGQAYRDSSNIFEIASGTNSEGRSQSAVNTQYENYSGIEGATPFLTGGIPNADTGKDSSNPYALGDIDISLTSSSVATVETLKFRINNVVGTSSYQEIAGTKVQVHTANPSGVSETAIPVANSLGNGNFTDDGVRIADFLSETTDTPTFTGSTNFYTNNPFTGAVAVAGTREATIRWGLLQHFTTNLSSGFLPAGPNRSGDTGRQYFTFAFRRQVVANFDIAINSSTGIAGMWIAAPGTGVDSASGLNGWLDTGTQYAGAGVPGSNTSGGGNGSDGCASTGADVVPFNTSLNSTYTMTLGSENMSNATGNVVLVRVALDSGDSITSISIGEAS